jgi:hypothetical protein
MNRRDGVAGVMQDVACLDFDRLQVRCKKFEISGGELPEQIVLGPTGHSFFSSGPGIGAGQNPTFPCRNQRFQSAHKAAVAAEKFASWRLRNSRRRGGDAGMHAMIVARSVQE